MQKKKDVESISYSNKQKNVFRDFNTARKSKDGKVLFENFVSLSLLQIAGYIFPLITIPYLSRVIGVEKFGEIAFASTVVGYFQTVIDWGFNFAATRDIARNRQDKDKVSEIFSTVIWAKLLLMAISLIILLILVLIIPKFRQMSILIILTFLSILGQIMFPEWLFQALERMKYITILNLIAKAIFAGAVFVFIREKSDFILQPLLTSLGYFFSGLIAMYIILRKWNIKLVRPSYIAIKNAIHGSADIFINNFMPNLYNSFSVLLLGFWGGPVSNGKLDAGSRFVSILSTFNAILSRTFYPFLSRKIDKHRFFAKINIYASLILSILLFLFAPLLIRIFFTPEFNDSIIVLRIMAFSIIFLTLSNVYGTNYMIIQGCEKELRNVTMRSSLIGLIISLPLVYYFDFIGAAITITLTRGILGMSISYHAKKIKNMNKFEEVSYKIN